MRFYKIALICGMFNITFFGSAKADVKVITSIKPVHSLVSAVMGDVASPKLIMEAGESPHTYSLKPSQARDLQNANIVFWMGNDIETFLEKPIKTVAKNATSVRLTETHGLKKLKFREGGLSMIMGMKITMIMTMINTKKDDHDDHDHDKHAKKDDHDDHDHDKHAKKDDHDDHDHDKHAKKDDHDDHDHHVHGEFDPHVWLDPVNAKALVHEIEEALIKADPKNARKYSANAELLEKQLDELVKEITLELKPVQSKGYIVFHDAYQYFEQRFGMSAIGSITVSPEVMPGAERIAELRDKIRDLSATCVFSEPQFEPKLVKTLVEGTNARTGVLDPIGSAVPSGPQQYFGLIRNMATSLKNCLAGE